MENRTTSRLTVWLFGLLSLLFTIGYFIWASAGNTDAAAESKLYPIPVFGRILAQLAEAAPPLDWNFPLQSMAVWLGWLFTTIALGMYLRRVLKTANAEESAAIAVCLAFALGFVAQSLLQLVLGLVGLTRFPLIPALFLLALVSLFARRQRTDILRILHAVRWQWKQLPAIGKAITIIAVISISLLSIPALTPPVQSDGVRYHLGAVQEYLKAGSITYLPSNAYSNMPFLVEMHFMAALACGAPEASQLMHFTLAVFTCLAIYALINLLSGNPDRASAKYIALAAAGLYLATPMSAVLATWPFTDHGISFFLIGSTLALTRVHNHRRLGTWVENGLLLGGLIGTKYTMAPIALALLAMPYIISAQYRHQFGSSRAQVFRYTAAVAVVAGLAGGVWYVKNWVFTGNPFYPLASGIFPGGEWTAEANEFLHERAGAKGMGKGLLPLLLSPWNATFHWLRFEAHNPGPTLFISLLCILTALAGWRQNTKRGALAGLIFVAMLSYGIWFFSYQSNRLLLPTIALMLAVVPAGALAASSLRRDISKIIAAFIFAGLYGLGWALQWSLVTTGLTPPPLPYLLGSQTRDVYRYKSLTYARAFDYLNTHVPPGEKVLLIGEHRIFGADFDAVWSDWFDTPKLAHIFRAEDITTLQGLLKYLESQNIRWILVNDAELAPQLNDFRHRFTSAEWQIYQQLRALSGPGVKSITLPPGVEIIQLEPAQ